MRSLNAKEISDLYHEHKGLMWIIEQGDSNNPHYDPQQYFKVSILDMGGAEGVTTKTKKAIVLAATATVVERARGRLAEIEMLFKLEGIELDAPVA